MRLYLPSSAISTLESFFKYSDIEIVKNPQVYFMQNKQHFNFDAVLILDGNTDNDTTLIMARHAGIPIYGIRRYDKMEQSIMMNVAGINMPDTWFSEYIANCNDIVSLMKDVQDNEKVIIKYSLGARGVGQILLKKRELIDLFDSDGDVLNRLFDEMPLAECKVISIDQPAVETIPTKHTIQPHLSEIERQLLKFKNIKINKHDCLLSAIKRRNDIIIQRYIPNRIEWRMLWFYDQFPIVVRRNVDDGSWQANACNNSSGSSTVVKMREIKEYGIDYDKLDKFFRGMNTPFMSVDIYYDKDTEQWGLFEFQMEFGWMNTVGIDSRSLNAKMLQSVRSINTKQKPHVTV